MLEEFYAEDTIESAFELGTAEVVGGDISRNDVQVA
jgi:hypothetical protein